MIINTGIQPTLLFLNLTQEEPDPIQAYQSWESKFENIRRYEMQEREREWRRERENSKDGMIEVLIVIGLLVLVTIPFLIWLYYRSPVCNPAAEQHIRRYSSGLTSPEKYPSRRSSLAATNTSLLSHEPFSIPLKQGHNSGFGCSKPSCVCGTKCSGDTKSKKKTWRNMKENAPYAPANV